MKYLILSIAAISFLATGCRHKVEYVDPKSNDGITTINTIDFQDWNAAGAQAVDSLLASRVLDKSPRQPAVLMVGTIRNDTTSHVDTDLLAKKIRVALNKSGKAVTTTAVGLEGAEDESSYVARQLRSSPEFDQGTVQPQGTMQGPGYSLAGKIIQLNSRAGNQRQGAFAFQLTLTDLRTGLAVWEDEVQIVKKGRKAGIGW